MGTTKLSRVEGVYCVFLTTKYQGSPRRGMGKQECYVPVRVNSTATLARFLQKLDLDLASFRFQPWPLASTGSLGGPDQDSGFHTQYTNSPCLQGRMPTCIYRRRAGTNCQFVPSLLASTQDLARLRFNHRSSLVLCTVCRTVPEPVCRRSAVNELHLCP